MNLKLIRFAFTFFLILISAGSFSVSAKAPVLTKKDLSEAPPRIIRTCCGFGVEIGIAGIPFAKKTDITSVEIMGSHQFLGGKTEKNGIIYTRRGGFLDLGHLRDCADITAYAYCLINAGKTDKKFHVNELRNEGGDKKLVLRVSEKFSDDEVIRLAGRISYDQSLWHEISTWFGARYVPMVSEKFSSFSAEDMYSNLMGVHIGMRAIKSNLPYNEAVTLELSNLLDTLQAVKTEAETFTAMLEVNNIWYTNEYKYPNNKLTLKRNFDFDTKMIPWRIPSENMVLQPYVLQIPDKSLHDFFQLSIDLNYRFPVEEIFPGKEDRIITQKDFDMMIDFIKYSERIGFSEAKSDNSGKEKAKQSKPNKT